MRRRKDETGVFFKGFLNRGKNYLTGKGLFPRYTQGPIEAVNGIIQLAKRRARGFRNLNYLPAIAYWIAGRLTLTLPSLLPT